MEYKVMITQTAVEDIDEIFRYIAVVLNEPAVATKMKNQILECIESLSFFPLRNKIIEEEPYFSKNIRKTSVKNYYVIYRIIDDTVLILRLTYSCRD